MSNNNVTEKEARYALGYIAGDMGCDIEKLINDAIVKYGDGDIDLIVKEVMKVAVPKPNPKLLKEILIKTMNKEVLTDDISAPAPKPKYDSCRRFKKGDIVKRREDIFGRSLREIMPDIPFDTEFFLLNDEKDGTVRIDVSGKKMPGLSFIAFELVTPVEEREPYSVKEEGFRYTVRDKNYEVVASFHKILHPHPDKAAEAECDRLNEAYRKEHGNEN